MQRPLFSSVDPRPTVPLTLSPTPARPAPLQKLGGYFTLQDALSSTGWQRERVQVALSSMAREGLLLIDDPPGAGG